MGNSMIRRFSLVAWIFLAALQAPVLAAPLKPQGYVSDFANLLTPAARTELQDLLRETEQQTSAEIALVTVPSLDGETVEQYANRLFKEWGIGKKGIDNGVLVLVAPAERKVRIEVGYGLEPVLPDGLAGEIIRTDVLPQFRSGDYPRGILDGVRHVSDVVRSHHVLTAEERRRLEPAQDKPPMLLMVPFFGLFIGLGAFAVGLGLRTRTFFPLLWGGMFGGIPFLMSLIPSLNAPVLILGPFGLAMFAWGFAKGHSLSWARSLRAGKGSSRSSGGWVMGASSGSGSSGSSGGSSGGGFGGGSSGGGGASGSW
jgi:uncharacterized protein